MAKKFNFRLESVLKLRAEKVTQAQESLNQAIKVRVEKEKSIQNYRNYLKNLSNEKSSQIKASDLQNMSYHKQYIDSEIKKLEKEKVQVLEIENLRRTKLTKALKDEKVLEKLKERKKADYNDELRKEEAKFFDEIAIKQSSKTKQESKDG